MNELETKLREQTKALLEQQKIDFIIGYEPGSLKFTTTPLITADKADADRLVLTPFIVNNLSLFLRKAKGKAGIVTKGCDSRSITSLIQDKQLVRENITIIAIPCNGLVDLHKVEQLTGKDKDELDGITLDGDKAIITYGGSKREHPAAQVLFDKCIDCNYHVPKEYDILIGEPNPVTKDKGLSLRKIKELQGMPQSERWKFWKQEFNRCIRCYACRQVCPVCSCQRCFAEETEPQWVSPLPHWQDSLIFQMTRVIHVAGRCADCGECERACPVHIPLRSLTRQMEEIVQELFHYEAGANKDLSPLMAAYEYQEAEDLIR